jgi:hypothetical protein
MIELGGTSGSWQPIEMDAQHFPLPQADFCPFNFSIF